MPSVHEVVGELLTRVRHEFTIANHNDPEGPAKAAEALRTAFRLLQVSSSSSTCTHSSVMTADNHQVDCDQMCCQEMKNNVFIHYCFLPFASFLLREVGPRWLNVWDRVWTTNMGSVIKTSEVNPDTTAHLRHWISNTRTSEPAARDMFDAFFRPPLVPASLAFLALCEGLGRYPTGIDGDSGGRATAGAPDARTVQQACRLLEPYLDSSIPWGIQPENGVKSLSATRLLSIDPNSLVLNETSTSNQHVSSEETTGEERTGASPLFVQAVMELENMEGGLNTDGADLWDVTVTAERLASALCLAPQRVANTLGPVAPPTFASTTFFAVVCRAVVHSVLYVRSPARKRPTDAETISRREETARRTDINIEDIPKPAEVENTTMRQTQSNVWRTFANHLLLAGRASDLADACLRAMAKDGPLTATLSSNVGDEGKGELAISNSESAHAHIATAWKAWAEGPESKAFSWMILEIPASRRKSLLEALLRTLWPRGRRREGDRVHHWDPGFPTAACHTLIGRTLLPRRKTTGSVEEGAKWTAIEVSRDEEVELSVGLVEDLVLRSPLPPPAAEAIAETLAWCDQNATGAGYTVAEENAAKPLVMGAIKRVAAVWAEPSFINSSPPRQQDFYSRFLLAALRSGVVDSAMLARDSEALILLVRGVSSHLEMSTRAFRLQGMRVGEVVAALSGQELRFEELDGEREEDLKPNRGSTIDRVKPEESAGELEMAKEGVEPSTMLGGESSTQDQTGVGSGKAIPGGRQASGVGSDTRKLGPRSSLGLARTQEELNPDMPLPLGGDRSDSDSDSDSEEPIVSGLRGIEDMHKRVDENTGDGWSYQSGSEGEEDDDEEEDDGLEAYDLWDDKQDLAKEAAPIYLDQLIELLRSRDQPETVDKHEIALEWAEKLVRRNPPDLAHRAAELTRDLLFLENPFELKDFETLRARAMVATTANAPETCVLFLSGVVWGSGASEGTKHEIFDVLIRAASELAGWTGQGEGGGEPSGRPSLLGGVGRERPYPSALMQEARGMTQGSVKRRLLRGRSSAGSDPKGHGEGSSGDRAANGTMTVSGATPSRDGSITETRTRRWGYRRGPRERPRRNLFGRFAPQFFYPLAQGMVLRLRESAVRPVNEQDRYVLPGSSPPPPPSSLFAARLLHTLTCFVELCGHCPSTPAMAADLLGLAWLLRIPARESRELRRAVLVAVATSVEHARDMAVSAALQGDAGEFLRWLESCAKGSDGDTRELAEFVLGNGDVQALASLVAHA